MRRNAALKKLQEMERLRHELYSVVNGKRELLNTKESYEVSTKLDKLIVKHMLTGLKRKSQ